MPVLQCHIGKIIVILVAWNMRDRPGHSITWGNPRRCHGRLAVRFDQYCSDYCMGYPFFGTKGSKRECRLILRV